ncbi:MULTISPECIES: TetR/AcrR family transcriptional regulator [unclassified Sphingobacterium]|uniref:TetR/AcrR family transcriptional regulator n=1 Tax=unclassified Sphingobacterium TaxID=2609468 RepID=UPI001AE9A42A|nr:MULTISPECIES: TetR/AcrR family transcriptional regulator [unclassified Sphingobacterium]MDR6736995.1 AcrR family transcriptional regulator [Sphingobacterium sp. 2149]
MSKAEHTRQFIIEKTAPIFNKKGYFATSLSDITTATGLTKGSIYGNFKDKDDLAIHVYTYQSKNISDAVHQQIIQQKTALKKLLSFFDFYKENFKAIAASGGCPMMNAAVEADDSLPFLTPKVKRSFDLWRQRLILILEEGIKNGEFKQDVSAEDYAITFMAMIEGGILLSKITGRGKDLAIVLEKMREMVNREIKS